MSNILSLVFIKNLFRSGLIPFSFLLRLLFSSLSGSLLNRLYVFYECFTVYYFPFLVFSLLVFSSSRYIVAPNGT